MKKVLIAIGIILAVASATAFILKHLPTPSIREDFICE